MKQLDYEKVLAEGFFELKELKNQLDQKLTFVQAGEIDLEPVIVLFDDLEKAYETNFFDANDFYEGSDYLPVLMDGEAFYAYETDLI